MLLGDAERRVNEKLLAVERDRAELKAAHVELSLRLREQLGRPAVLLALFAAGLGVGWLRKRRPLHDEEGPKEGRLAGLLAALVAGVRLYERARRAAAYFPAEQVAEPDVDQQNELGADGVGDAPPASPASDDFRRTA